MKDNFQKKDDPSEKGSITLFVAFLLPLMFIMVVLVADIGQLIFEKIRLQNVVDAVALAAAGVQSAGLNEIADLNSMLKIESWKLQLILASGIWHRKSQARSAIRFFKGGNGVLTNIHRYQKEANEKYFKWADDIAKLVKLRNLPFSRLESLNKGNKLIKFTSKKRSVYYLYWVGRCFPKPCIRSTRVWSNPDDPRRIGGHWGVRGAIANRLFILPGRDRVLERIKKVKTPMTYAAYKVTQYPKSFIHGWRPPWMPKLEAYAAAKPTGGYISGGKAKYRPIMVKLKDLRPKPNVPNLSKFEH